MVIDVNVLTAEPTDNSLDVTVSVNTSSRSLTTDYEVRISDSGTGGVRNLRGSLDGTAGFGPGDEVIHEVSFDLTPPGSGTVTAEITSPQQYAGTQDQRNWETAAGGINVNECGSQPTSSGDLEVSYTLTPSLSAAGETYEVGIIVGGQRVGSATHEVPNRTISRTQTIPADDLPTGSDMPVEIEVDGDFRECGTVTVEGDDPAPEPPADLNPSVSGCEIESEDPLTVSFDLFASEQGSTSATVVVDGQPVHSETVDYNPNGGFNEITVPPTTSVPTGRNMPVEIDV